MHVAQFYLSIFIAAISTSALAATEAFKCTAEDGKISYLDTRPATGCVTIEVVRINVGKGTPGDDQATADDAGSSTDPADPKYDKEVAEKQAEMKKDCDTKKTNLNTLKTSSNVQTKDEEGKTRRMTAEEQVKMTKDVQDYLDTYCSAKPK